MDETGYDIIIVDFYQLLDEIRRHEVYASAHPCV
ncbi:hypothetical protein AVEN_142588-1, partial [Araneus ventricosus]